MNVLSQTGRDSIIRALFDTSGCNFDFCRLPLGANDYIITPTVHRTLDDSSGDYDLTAFSIAQDRLYLIPFIKAAQVYQPNIRIWAIPWNAPNWLIPGIQQNNAQAMTTYANYFEKFVKAYQAEGINVCAVGIHNEPDIDPGTPWLANPTHMAYWIKNYWGPLFTKDLPNVEMWLADFCNADNNNWTNWIQGTLIDTAANKYLPAVGLQWSHPEWISQIRSRWPSKRIIECESQPGNPNGTWDLGQGVFNNMYTFLSQWCSLYSQWNMVLDQTGNSNDDWAQQAMIHVDQRTKSVKITPYFYFVKHFAHYVKTGARVVKIINSTTGISSRQIAFKNPNGDIIVVSRNEAASAQQVTIKLGDQMLQTSLPANSVNTFEIKQAVSAVVASRAVPNQTSARIFKVTGGRFIVPRDLQGKSISVAAYDCRGKLLPGSAIKNHVATKGISIVKVTANKK